jgi:hypothetical protein
MWDISPAGIGNAILPETFQDQMQFFDFDNGGDNGTGHDLNPFTGQPYAPNMVRRGDYTRVLAEFWADGPNSETPPGHWFWILNYVIEQLNGNFYWEGSEALSEMEYCVKAYLTLGGALHDAAISAWGIKGYYDGVRPISAIRYLAENGQGTDATLPNFNINGIPLISGYTELVQPGDPLAGANNENVNKVKMWTWKGPSYITDPATTTAGVGWILAENWYPYQRPTFVTPPFAGYVSGHSTYSRTGAEVMTAITGNEYFPNGMGVFDAPMNQYLVFEDGPSATIELQWATYRDASDQCSLSRIWGGIHPPMDDIAGRKIGIKVADHALTKADRYWVDNAPKIVAFNANDFINDAAVSSGYSITVTYNQPMNTTMDPGLFFTSLDLTNTLQWNDQFWLNDSTFVWNFVVIDNNEELSGINIKIMSAVSLSGEEQRIYYRNNAMEVDTRNPLCTALNISSNQINQAFVDTQSLLLDAQFDEEMLPNLNPQLSGSSNTFLNGFAPQVSWMNATAVHMSCQFPDVNEMYNGDLIQLAGLTDMAGNAMVTYLSDQPIQIDTQEPVVTFVTANLPTVNESAVGQSLLLKIGFNSPVNAISTPQWMGLPLGMNMVNYSYPSSDTLICEFSVDDVNEEFAGPIGGVLSGVVDDMGNALGNGNLSDLLLWDTQSPEVANVDWWWSDGSGVINPVIINEFNVGVASVYTIIDFSENMDTTAIPSFTWNDVTVQTAMTVNSYDWIAENQLKVFWDVIDNDYNNFAVSLTVDGYQDALGNIQDTLFTNYMQWAMMLVGPIQGCTDSLACNYLPFANVDDGSCWIIGATCDDGNALTENDVVTANCECQGILISVSDLEAEDWFVYPNPATDILYSNTTGYIEIFNALGKKIWAGRINENEPLSISDWSNGWYWVKNNEKVIKWLKVE